jgi:hypothetical protein
MLMIKSINGWVEDNRNLGMFSKVIDGEHVQTYVPRDGNAHRKLALVHLTNPVLLRVIPHIFPSWLDGGDAPLEMLYAPPVDICEVRTSRVASNSVCAAAPLIVACAMSTEREPSELLAR